MMLWIRFDEKNQKPEKNSSELATFGSRIQANNRWYFWATHSQLDPIISAAKTTKEHWEGILNWFDSQISTGILEGFNSLIQAAKARARGYRTNRNLITMVYLIAGKLDYGLPT